MDRDTIIRLAREAGFADGVVEIVGLEGFSQFAAIVAAHERKAKPITADEMSAWVKDTWEKCQAEAWQEPVAWQWLDTANYRKKLPADAIPEHWRPLYTAPTPRRPLTDEEISVLWEGHTVPVFDKTGINPIVFARAIERAHGIGDSNG